jgi:hypothetical protein
MQALRGAYVETFKTLAPARAYTDQTRWAELLPKHVRAEMVATPLQLLQFLKDNDDGLPVDPSAFAAGHGLGAAPFVMSGGTTRTHVATDHAAVHAVGVLVANALCTLARFGSAEASEVTACMRALRDPLVERVMAPRSLSAPRRLSSPIERAVTARPRMLCLWPAEAYAVAKRLVAIVTVLQKESLKALPAGAIRVTWDAWVHLLRTLDDVAATDAGAVFIDGKTRLTKLRQRLAASAFHRRLLAAVVAAEITIFHAQEIVPEKGALVTEGSESFAKASTVAQALAWLRQVESDADVRRDMLDAETEVAVVSNSFATHTIQLKDQVVTEEDAQRFVERRK